MFKITAKTKMDTLKQVLHDNFTAIKAVNTDDAKALASTIKYASDHADKTTRKDLADMVKDTMKLLGDKFIEPMPVAAETKTETTGETQKKGKKSPAQPKAENSVKKPVGKKLTKVEDSDESDEEEVAEPKTETKAKKSAKKSTTKKVEGVTALESETDSPKSVQLAKMFPETIEVDGETFKVDHTIKKIEDLADGEFEFAFYWTKRHLRQFPYFNGSLGQPKSFERDLDTAQLIYVSDEGKVAYCVSDATEAPYTVLPADLEEVDGMRIGSVSSIEFQIYRKVESK